VLEAYSVMNPQAGYVQSMNFIVGFVLLISGAKEKETFWFFNSILEKSLEPIPFDGLQGFYQDNFPLLF
jgi:hypothetical protein